MMFTISISRLRAYDIQNENYQRLSNILIFVSKLCTKLLSNPDGQQYTTNALEFLSQGGSWGRL